MCHTSVQKFSTKMRLSGIFMFMTIFAIFQDIIGKEAYIELVNKYWFDCSLYFWFFMFLLSIIYTNVVEKRFSNKLKIESFIP